MLIPRKLPKIIFKKMTQICKKFNLAFFHFLRQLLINIIIPLIGYLKQRKIASLVLIILIAIVGVIYSGIQPFTSNFEGNLLVKSIEFTYVSEQPDRLFINNITNIRQLTLEGINSFTLHGKFTNTTNPKIQKILNNYDKLKVELFDNKSQFIINHINYKQLSSLELSELHLQPNTKIFPLKYYSDKNSLLISIIPKEIFNSEEKPNSLSINFGEQPLRIQLNSYNLPEFKKQINIEEPSSIEFDLQPDGGQIEIEINHASRLLIELQTPIETNNKEWFRGDLEVKDVNFNEIDTTGVNFNNDIEKSTIIKGEVRMRGKSLKIESNQFFIPQQPGVKRLRNIEVIHPRKNTEIELSIAGEKLEISEPMEGLEVRFAGETKGIKTGLDKRFPIGKIQSNLLANFGFSNELIIAIISSASAIVVSLLTWLVNDFLSWLASASKSTQNP